MKIPENLLDLDLNAIDIKCDPKVWQALEEGIKRYNKQAISNAQKLQYFAILPHDFSLVTGELGELEVEGLFFELFEIKNVCFFFRSYFKNQKKYNIAKICWYYR